MINDTEGDKSSEVNSREQIQTSSMVYNAAEGRISSEDINNLYNRKKGFRSKGSDRVVGGDKSNLEGMQIMINDKTVDCRGYIHHIPL